MPARRDDEIRQRAVRERRRCSAIRSPPRTEAPSKRSGSAKAGRSSMTATSKSRSRAWRAMARETWPPPAMTSWGRLVTGSTSSSLRVVERHEPRGAVAHLLDRRVAGALVAAGRAERAEHPAAGQDQHPRVEPQRASGAMEGRHERHRRPAAGGVGGRRDRVDAVDRRRPRRSAAGFREDPHRAAAHEPGVPGQFLGELVFAHASPARRRGPCGRRRWRRLPRSRRRACRTAVPTRRRSGSAWRRRPGACCPGSGSTVATANGTPAAASSCMRSKGDDMCSVGRCGVTRLARRSYLL